MAIGKDPREWIVELCGFGAFVVSAQIAYTSSDLTLGIASAIILILTVYLWRLRVKLSISVTAGS